MVSVSPRPPLVVMYHRISTEFADPYGIQVAPTVLRSQLEYLKANYRLLSLSEFVDALASGCSLAGCASVTFDDGYQSVFTYAKPILEEMAVPATVFMTDHFISGQLFWWDRLAALADHARRADEAGAPDDAFWETWTQLRALPPEDRDESLDRMTQDLGLDALPPYPRPMSEWQAKHLASDLISIGAHTRTHPDLTVLTSDEMIAEIQGSRDDLEAFFGRPILHFSYPFGEYNDEVIRQVGRAGFTGATIVRQRLLFGTVDRFTIPRFALFDRTGEKLHRKLERAERRQKTAQEAEAQ
jgi:peptidoglycan/xylan/chitin deacetylase (PgdA/CDA1 family)